jgi:hypothetical protein
LELEQAVSGTMSARPAAAAARVVRFMGYPFRLLNMESNGLRDEPRRAAARRDWST